jgi:hypothetical protein
MEEIISGPVGLGIILGGWLLLQMVILPRFGVRT